MTKNRALLLLAGLLLSGCARTLPALPTVTTKAEAKQAASFCNVEAGDPDRSVYVMGAGKYLKCDWAK